MQRTPSPRRSGAAHIFHAVLHWVFLALIALGFLACAFVAVGGVLGRWRLASVPTGSMAPTIESGSAIVIVPKDVEDVVVGDVIVFTAPETQVRTVHRVVGVETVDGSPTFQTRGDANPVNDPWRLQVNGTTVGHVVSVIPGVGTLSSFMSGVWIRLAVAVLGAASILYVGLRVIWGPHPLDHLHHDDGEAPGADGPDLDLTDGPDSDRPDGPDLDLTDAPESPDREVTEPEPVSIGADTPVTVDPVADDSAGAPSLP